MGYHSYVYIMQ